jgi:MoaA/NifB/PqqE/SkfB family radical SAM enzyme
MMPIELSIETAGSCNRTCPTCERNSAPFPLPGRFGKQQRMPDALFTKILADAAEMGFGGWLNLQYFNEPLQDPRIARFAAEAKATGIFSRVYMHSNADLLTARKAAELDGKLDAIVIALYDEDGGRARADFPARRALISSWFHETTVEWATAEHLVTHWSPYANLAEEIERNRPLPCIHLADLKIIIDYRGEMLMCCDDIAGAFGLGNVADRSLSELWYSPRHLGILATLAQPGGREAYELCRTCPRTECS